MENTSPATSIPTITPTPQLTPLIKPKKKEQKCIGFKHLIQICIDKTHAEEYLVKNNVFSTKIRCPVCITNGIIQVVFFIV